MPSVSGRALWTVYLVMLMDTLNFGIVFPLLPAIAKSFGASATLVGSMATTYSFCQMVATPILGRVSDKYGRRPVLLISLLGTLLSSVATGLAWNFPVLIAARCINGLSGGTVGVVNAYVADVTTRDEKATYMSYIAAANSIGIIVGPAVGGLLSHWGFASACYVSGALSGVNLLMALPFLKESRWSQAREISAPLNGQAGEVSGAPRRHSVPCLAYYLYFAGFLLVFGFAAMESIVAYFLMDTYFGGDEKKTARFYGYLFMAVGVAMFVMAGLCYKPLRKRFGEMPLVIVGMSVRTGGFVLQALAPSVWWFAGGTLLIVSGNQLTFPTTASLLTTMCHHSIYGRALGMQQAFQALARVIGPMTFGAAYDHVSHTFAFYACAIMTVVAGVSIVVAWLLKPTQEDVPPIAEVAANVDELDRAGTTSGPLTAGTDSPACKDLVRSISIDTPADLVPRGDVVSVPPAGEAA